MSAGDGVLDAAAITELRDRHYGEGSIPEHHSAHPCDACRLLLTFAARPAPDPAGLDVERLADMAVMSLGEVTSRTVYGDIYRQFRARFAARVRRAAEYARLSVADGPGPEERPE